MKLFIEVIIFVIILASARAYDLNGSLGYGVGQTAFSLNSINSSNSSQLYNTYDLEKTEVAMAGRHSWFAQSSRIRLINNSVNINYRDLYSIRRADVALNLKNRSNLSIWPEGKQINISDKQIFDPKKFGIKHADMYFEPARSPNALITQPINFNFGGKNLTDGLFPSSTIGQSSKIEQSAHLNQSNKPTIFVHTGESIQDAINAASSGDVIEIDSGTYNESLHINKSLTIRGVDVGGGIPIIDANGAGNAVEISADHVILEKIVSTNSSKASMSPGAGLRFSSSDNCSIDRIVSYNNYYGINLVDSNNNTISNSNISNSQYGVRIYFSNNNMLEQSDVKKTLNPLAIISSEDNIIQGNVFRDNLHKVEISKDNKITNNDDIFVEDHNESKKVVEPNARPRPQLSQSYYHEDSDKDGDGIELVPNVVPIHNSKEYENLAQKATATLVFNPPKVMTREVGEWIDARISPENTTNLVQGLLGKGDVQFRNISLAMNMTYIVKLESDRGFEILAKRPDAQILGIDPPVWLWMVTPLEEGNHTLILTVDLQLEKPPYNCRCIKVTNWPVMVKVMEQSPQQRLMDIISSSHSLIGALIAFLASLFSLIILFRQLKKGKEGEK